MAEPYITIRGLRKSYVMGANVIHALDGLDLDVERRRDTLREAWSTGVSSPTSI